MRHARVPVDDDDDDEELGAAPRKPSDHESTAFSKSDLWVLSLLALLVVGVIVKMAVKDMAGIDFEACENGRDTMISKHLHCVTNNNSNYRDFGQFLAQQGAKKEHPNYVAERARIHGAGGKGAEHDSEEGTPSPQKPARARVADPFAVEPGVVIGAGGAAEERVAT